MELLTPPFCLVPGTEVEGQKPVGKEPQESWLLVHRAELGCFGWLPLPTSL